MVIFVATLALMLTVALGIVIADHLGAFDVEVPPVEGAPHSLLAARPRGDARLLFCETHGRSLTVDCIDHTGTPVALQLVSPETRMFSAVTTAIVRNWARDERVVALELSRDGHHVTLDDGSTRLYLELATNDFVA